MSLLKSMLTVAVVTLVALIYVHQQVELVKLSYAIDRKEKAFKETLDHTESLRYNISSLESPSRLEKVLVAQKIEVIFPKRGQIVNLVPASTAMRRTNLLRIAGLEERAGIFGFFDFLGSRVEAHAKEK